MMSNPHLLLCNGARLSTQKREWAGPPVHELWTHGKKKNVTLKITDITGQRFASLTPVLKDLVELAALVYAADQCCKRQRGQSFDYGDAWYRTFRFEVAVREPGFWSQRQVVEALCDTLGFLSGDNYDFAFERLLNPPSFDGYLDIKPSDMLQRPVERVMLFSAGLDSLGGAVREVLVHRRKVAMVSHKSVSHWAVKQRALVRDIAIRARDDALAPLHVPVLANKDGEMSNDSTQRTRSFLFASLATAVADQFGMDAV